MSLLEIINADEYSSYSEKEKSTSGLELRELRNTVNEIISAVRTDGDRALFHYSTLFEKAVPEVFEVPKEKAKEAWEELEKKEPLLADALKLAANNIRIFNEAQKDQLKNFEKEISPGLICGQRVIPVQKAAVYVPGGRFPLISSALMGLIPASVAGVEEKILVSPPGSDALPNRNILAAGYLAGADRYFALGGAQAIASLAIGTESVPKVDLIVGPGNKYVAEAKALLYGEVGIDFIAGPTDLLIISDCLEEDHDKLEIIAADMLAQAEHDPDARARVLLPGRASAEALSNVLEKRLNSLAVQENARASLESGALAIVYSSKEEAINIANLIAPEHLELHLSSSEEWIDALKNYGSLFIGDSSAEVLGDYSAGINHTLPTSGASRFTGGLSVLNFLKIVTSLKCSPGDAYLQALKAARQIALAEGLEAHAESASLRIDNFEGAVK